MIINRGIITSTLLDTKKGHFLILNCLINSTFFWYATKMYSFLLIHHDKSLEIKFVFDFEREGFAIEVILKRRSLVLRLYLPPPLLTTTHLTFPHFSSNETLGKNPSLFCIVLEALAIACCVG